MKFSSKMVMTLMLSFAMTGCGLLKKGSHDDSRGGNPEENTTSKIEVRAANDNQEIAVDEFNISLKVDSKFSPEQRQTVYETFKNIKSYALIPDQDAFFSKFFESIPGDTAAAKIYRYLAPRTRYLIKYKQKSSRDTTVAENTSSMLFMINLHNKLIAQGALRATKEPVPSILFNGNPLPTDKLNVGLFSVADLFFDKRQSNFDRFDTMVHEARHSDCEVKPTVAQFKDFLNTQNPKSLNGCLHMHAVCPSGHNLAGLAACDERPWGSYSMSYAIQNLVTKYCKNCSDAELAVAKMSEIDMRSRIKNADTFLSDSSKPSLKHVEE